MTATSKNLDEIIHQIACRELLADKKLEARESHPLLAKLKTLGSELWIDTGDLEKAESVWKKELSALTTNNTLANQVVQSGIMDEVIEDALKKIKDSGVTLSDEDLVLEIGFVINCRIALRLVEAFRVKVSVELHPSMAWDMEKSLAFARRYFKVCPEFFILKLPLTPEGYLAVRKLSQEGMPVNFTLGFSARQNYLAGRLSNPAYTNVFLGRLNAVVKDNGLGSGDFVGEKVTLATQRALIELRQAGKSHTKLIGASIRNGAQVGTLSGLDVLTIPPPAMQEFLESGKSADEVQKDLDPETETGINAFNSLGARFPQLWEVPDTFKTFVDNLLNHTPVDELIGEDLVRYCEKHGVDLFYNFTEDDLKKIYDHGKIPRLTDWPGGVALDDLMTQSALQSFAKDQDALDERIRSFIK